MASANSGLALSFSMLVYSADICQFRSFTVFTFSALYAFFSLETSCFSCCILIMVSLWISIWVSPLSSSCFNYWMNSVNAFNLSLLFIFKPLSVSRISVEVTGVCCSFCVPMILSKVAMSSPRASMSSLFLVYVCCCPSITSLFRSSIYNWL